jgi:YHS domain-containing protein
MVKDPVCEMSVDEQDARNNGLVSEHEGRDFYFCSKDCKDMFDRFPDTYTNLHQKPTTDLDEGYTSASE